MNKAVVLIILLFGGINGYTQPINNFSLVGFKQERTGGAPMNNEDGTSANVITTDYWLFIRSKNMHKPLIKSFYIKGFITSFKLMPIKKIPDFITIDNKQKLKKATAYYTNWQIVVDVAETGKTNQQTAVISQKNEVVVVLKNNQKLYIKNITKVAPKVYE